MKQLKNLFKSLFCHGLGEKYFYFCTAYTYCTIFLKQMILKYLRQTVFILLWAMLISSCLNSSNSGDFELSKDAQIYTFRMSAVKDTSRYLSDAKFSIDQLRGRIFNQDSLPYLFNLDSVDIDIAGKSGLNFSNIKVILKDKDSTINTWNGKDSLAFKRIKSIETTAMDGKTTITYEISINIHQQNPYIFNWGKMADNYITAPIEKQKTVSFAGAFFTYYVTGGQLRASSAATADPTTWKPVVISGLPANVDISSLIAVTQGSNPIIYARTEDNALFRSINGTVWNKVEIEYPVKSIFGKLPSVSGESSILVAVEDGGALKFATTTDFISLKLWNSLDAKFPLKDFSSVSLESSSVHAAKYIILYGGTDISNNTSDKLWIIQEKDGSMTSISKKPAIDITSARLFTYDSKVYLMTFDGTKNSLYFSNNYGLNWISGGESQTLSEEMTVRKESTVITDSDNFIWIFGGKSVSNSHIVDVWRGRLNKLAK